MSENNNGKKVSKIPKTLRQAGIVSGIVLAVLIALLAVILLLRNVIVEQAVTRIAPLVTGTPVQVDKFSSNLFTGEIILKGFKVGNPEGYVEPHAIVLDTLRVRLSPGSLLKDKITVSEIFISGVGINFEIKANGSSNLTDIKKNVDSFAKSAAPAGEKKAAAKTESKEPSSKKQVVIALLRQEQGFISTSVALTQTTMRIPLPAVEMTEIGGGSSLAETISTVFSEMLTSAGKAIASSGLNMENLKGISDSVFKNITDGGNIVIKGGKEGGSVVVKGASDTGKALVDGVNSILKLKVKK